MIPEKYLKGIVHLSLAFLAAGEVIHAKTPARRLLIGAAAGWHGHAAFYHFILEKDTSKESQEWEQTMKGMQ